MGLKLTQGVGGAIACFLMFGCNKTLHTESGAVNAAPEVLVTPGSVGDTGSEGSSLVCTGKVDKPAEQFAGGWKLKRMVGEDVHPSMCKSELGLEHPGSQWCLKRARTYLKVDTDQKFSLFDGIRIEDGHKMFRNQHRISRGSYLVSDGGDESGWMIKMEGFDTYQNKNFQKAVRVEFCTRGEKTRVLKLKVEGSEVVHEFYPYTVSDSENSRLIQLFGTRNSSLDRDDVDF